MTLMTMMTLTALTTMTASSYFLAQLDLQLLDHLSIQLDSVQDFFVITVQIGCSLLEFHDLLDDLSGVHSGKQFVQCIMDVLLSLPNGSGFCFLEVINGLLCELLDIC
jgi:hypothetical protein